MELIDKATIVTKIKDRIKGLQNFPKENGILDSIHKTAILLCINECEVFLSLLNTLEVKEINTWHLQKNEDIYDAIKDWSLHSFICLMDDGSIQKFTGICDECEDGSINTHIDAIDEKYDTDNIIFWIETPL